ncbi:protein chromosome transmission fidelity 7 [Quercus suber]|uniref:Protein chromosome transmission fidelity 7 n=1 Tax=Quercus suber TaxID=58331 RepID=A0AAW0KFD1_QUESU
MQAKISTFFKNPISTSIAPKSPDPPPIFDELTIWENKQHQFFNTYSRRAQNPDSNNGSIGDILGKKPNSDNLCSIAKSKSSERAIKTNKKRTYAQLHLDLGQSDFNLHTCSTCGGWCSERVVHMPSIEGGRIVLVLDCDPVAHRSKVEEVVKMMEIELGSGWIFHKSCKVYLFISSQRIVGCLLAEPIKQAFKVCSCSSNGGSEGTSAKEVARQSSTSLQFGDISFKREVKKRTRSVNSSEVLDGNLNGAIICENEGVPAVCGIRAIWVTPSNRRKHIASQLLDAVRIVGCLLAEPIKQAFKVCSCSSNGGSEGTSAKEVARQSSTSLQFGDISFKREVKKRTRSVNSSEVLDGNLNGAIICENEGVPAVCGIRAIWVTPSNRRKHIASQLLDAVRMSFCMGSVLELSQLALSQPTSAGEALASNYFSTGSFLVYKTNRNYC